MTAEPPRANGGVAAEVHALRREMGLVWDAHKEAHSQHELAHGREHQFAQTAIEKAAVLAQENKADANEWRETMNDRESKFATKEDAKAILARLDGIERANIVRDERERQRVEEEAEQKRESERRVTRSQWTIGLLVGVLATIGSILINLVIRLSQQS